MKINKLDRFVSILNKIRNIELQVRTNPSSTEDEKMLAKEIRKQAESNIYQYQVEHNLIDPIKESI